MDICGITHIDTLRAFRKELGAKFFVGRIGVIKLAAGKRRLNCRSG